jgi:hypothetical protein
MTDNSRRWLSRVYADNLNAGSTERALKNAREVILELLPEGEVPQQAQVALDDLEVMLRCISRD